MTEYKPLRLYPCYKEYLWGGTRLKKEFGKTDAPDVTAESWELAELEAAGKLMMLCPSGSISVSTLEGDMERLGALYLLGRADTKLLLPEIRAYFGLIEEKT